MAHLMCWTWPEIIQFVDTWGTACEGPFLKAKDEKERSKCVEDMEQRALRLMRPYLCNLQFTERFEDAADEIDTSDQDQDEDDEDHINDKLEKAAEKVEAEIMASLTKEKILQLPEGREIWDKLDKLFQQLYRRHYQKEPKSAKPTNPPSVFPPVDVISENKGPVSNPVKNKFCEHIYQVESVLQFIQRNPKSRCQYLSCPNHLFLRPEDLIRDEECEDLITASQQRKLLTRERNEEVERKKQERDQLLDNLRYELAHIRQIEAKRDVRAFLSHIYTLHSPKTSANYVYDESGSLKTAVRKAMSHYHPDKQVGQSPEWQVLAEEITKCLTTFKFDY